MARYYKDGKERWLAQIHGCRLVLDDGSVWEVGHLDADKVTHWIRFSNMVVTEIEAGERSFYVLTNKSFDSDVAAKFLGLRTNPLADVA
jgi:hypothetical protein